MPYTSNPKLTKLAQTLRRNMTREEKHLWYDFLKNLPVMVHRQLIIGNYIVDFCIEEYGIIIELDGSQHGENPQRSRDIIRDDALQRMGYRLLRYPNHEVTRHFSSVCQDIWNHLDIKEAE